MRMVSIKTYLAILSFGITGATLMISFFILYPTIQNIQTISRNMRTKHEEFTLRQARAQNPERSLKELDNVELRTETLESAMVETGKELVLIQTFEKLAETGHLEQTIKLEDVTANEYQFTLTSKGNFSDHVRFLHALETLPYYVHINKINWTKDRGEQTRVTARFDATVYATAP